MLRTISIALSLVIFAACQESPQLLDGRGPDISSDFRLQLDRPPFSWPEAGDLTGQDVSVAGSDRCVGASNITLVSGAASVTGNTAAAKNEFSGAIRCGGAVPFVGPQHYYKIALTRAKFYRFTLTPQFKGVLYLFSECGKNIINSDCSSGGASGDLAGPVAAGGQARITFSPDDTGTYYLGVDSASSADAGTFTLKAEELAAPKNASCKTAQALTLAAGKATVSGTTLGATNEFSTTLNCGLGVSFIGPQVYYAATLTKGAWYRLSLTPKFSGALWVASDKAQCKYTNINVDCGGIGGTVLPLVSSGKTGQVAFSPMASGKYIVAVGSPVAKASGDFSLSIEAFTPSGNMVCAGATKVLMTGDKGSVKGTTVGSLNDTGAAVMCGNLPPLVGPQRYHQVDLNAKPYRLQFKPTFPAILTLGKTCASLPADCGTNGLAGGAIAVGPGATGTLIFAPPSAGTYLLSVDSAAVTGQGSYEVLIQEDKKPTNGACGAPGTMTLAGSPTSELGDTSALKNDLTGVSCGLKTGALVGPAAYFKVSLLGGKTYTVTLTPEKTFDPALYAFPAATTCAVAAVNIACKGTASDKVGAGVTETLTFKPSSKTDMILAVDSWSPSEVGRFTLTVSWK